MSGIELRSTAFNDHAIIPERYSKTGENVSPELEWSGVPDGAAELLLICEDPDAPSGTFLHWLETGIDPHARHIGPGERPPGGTAWRNGFGEDGYGGPQPPVGDPPHRYFFRVYALDEPVHLPGAPSPEEVHEAIRGHELASGTLVGLFGR
ncbi:YbhB/YbcL family Raf kinase inhibitor-like protein [Allostreptomyces psammosilenae]|uniref:Phosphatidylethanolamine-binding protein n=1 Tax=Allostreptomyces psammosilenae TaxID=1892865 RepID=A0A852ZZD1_9ACTN|nr:YbhB/YbcL family Raf kinase inhibitor-like protein [Allostreptomyces psammosilenae]NYI03632.1 hypothetical protein [Allostreptomyces psammosilenae]